MVTIGSDSVSFYFESMLMAYFIDSLGYTFVEGKFGISLGCIFNFIGNLGQWNPEPLTCSTIPICLSALNEMEVSCFSLIGSLTLSLCRCISD